MGAHNRTTAKGTPADIPAIATLKSNRDLLQELSQSCEKTMIDVTAIAGEVGGKPTRSPRFYTAMEIKDRVEDLIALAEGRFVFHLPAESHDAES
jgi:hypothetical protein